MGVDDKNAKTPKLQSQKVQSGPAKRMGRPPLTDEARRSRKRLRALLHGVNSNSPVIPGMENEADWLRHRDGIVASLEPVGGMEEYVAQRIAILFWKLNRVLRYEVAVTMLHIDRTAENLTIANAYRARTLSKGKFEDPDPDELAERWETRILPSQDDSERITSQERHLHRQWVQTLHEFEALQARRKGHPVNLARIDFSAPPAA